MARRIGTGAAKPRPSKAVAQDPEKTLGTLIDALYEARQVRLDHQRELDRLKAAEGEAEQRVIALLNRLDLNAARGSEATVALNPKVVGQVAPEEWSRVHAYVAKTGAWDLLQKRLNNAAVRERVENGEEIPGVKTVTVLELRVRAHR